MGVACLCPCGRRWPVAVDLATHRGEVALLCPGCGREAGRLLCGTDLDATVPPSQADADRTQPPAFGIDEEVEPEEVGVGAPTRPLGEYELLGELGRGGMGVVYKARHRTLNRVVALKMILSAAHVGADGRARFRDEAEAIARLRHPNIVQIYDIGELGGDDFFSLEFCPGGSLARKLHGKPLPPRDAAATVEAVSRAVQAAHDAGIVHRDLKPGNILLDADGVPKVTDFGLAKKLDDSSGKTRTGAVMGTPSYMAPEQAEGKKDVGPLADVYALGAILYECLTGRPPFQAATSFDTILQVVSDEPVPPRRLNSKVPRDLEVIALKCLAKNPRARYARAADLADDLRRFLDGEPIRARPPGIVRQTWLAMRKRPIYALVAVLFAATALFGVYDYARTSGALRGLNWEEVRRIFNLLGSESPKEVNHPRQVQPK